MSNTEKENKELSENEKIVDNLRKTTMVCLPVPFTFKKAGEQVVSTSMTVKSFEDFNRDGVEREYEQMDRTPSFTVFKDRFYGFLRDTTAFNAFEEEEGGTPLEDTGNYIGFLSSIQDCSQTLRSMFDPKPSRENLRSVPTYPYSKAIINDIPFLFTLTGNLIDNIVGYLQGIKDNDSLTLKDKEDTFYNRFAVNNIILSGLNDMIIERINHLRHHVFLIPIEKREDEDEKDTQYYTTKDISEENGFYTTADLIENKLLDEEALERLKLKNTKYPIYWVPKKIDHKDILHLSNVACFIQLAAYMHVLDDQLVDFTTRIKDLAYAYYTGARSAILPHPEHFKDVEGVNDFDGEYMTVALYGAIVSSGNVFRYNEVINEYNQNKEHFPSIFYTVFSTDLLNGGVCLDILQGEVDGLLEYANYFEHNLQGKEFADTKKFSKFDFLVYNYKKYYDGINATHIWLRSFQSPYALNKLIEQDEKDRKVEIAGAKSKEK